MRLSQCWPGGCRNRLAGDVVWEVKSPSSGNIRVVQKHIRAALHQSRDVVFGSRRMKGLSDDAVEREVRKWTASLTSVRRMLYINRAVRVKLSGE